MAPAGERPAVLVTSRSFGAGSTDPEGALDRAGLRVVRGDPGHDVDGLAPVLAEAMAWVAGAAWIGPEHLARAPSLRLIARYGTGVDAVDLVAARARGVVVTNTPGANAEAVADHALALMLASLRHVVDADAAVRSGAIPRLVGRELNAVTIGIVGLGHVGRAVARRLRALGAAVVGTDPAVEPGVVESLGVGVYSLDDVLAGSDVVTLHCPGGGPPVLDRPALERMRPGVIVVNTARHDVVDEAALADLLIAGHVGAAAVDVTSDADSPLLTAPRTIVTPHIGGHTVEAIDRMGEMAATDVIRALVHGEPPLHPVTR